MLKQAVTTIGFTLIFAILLSACGGGGNDSGGNNNGSANDTQAPLPPSAPVISIVSGGKISISGTAEPGSTLRALFPDGTTTQVTVTDDGHYSLTSNAPYNGGTLTLSATDLAGNTSPQTTVSIPLPGIKKGTLLAQIPLSKPITGVSYRTKVYNDTGATKPDGTYEYKEGETGVTFTIAGQQYSVNPADKINLEDLFNGDDNDNDIYISNLKLIVINLDKDSDRENGYDLSTNTAREARIDPSSSNKKIIKTLYKITGKQPQLPFSPSLGINTEAPQAEADTAGQAMPFVDIFRTARPFAELSGDAKFDVDGWPTEIASDLTVARTKILQGTLAGAIPSGNYTLFYEGSGTIELGGPVSNIKSLDDEMLQGFTFDLNLVESDSPEANALNLNIKDIAPGEGNYIKNIRIIMPGGTCKDINNKHNPFIHVTSQTDCPEDTLYESFADRLKNIGRNSLESIVFNPDYLGFLREFKVVRMMNLMEASHGTSSCAVTIDDVTEIDTTCVKEPVKWSERAKLADAVWGGSGRTPHTRRNGVPVEVIVSLANTLQRDMWVNMPHYADDEFISSFADYVSQNLDQSLKSYVEYSNETWNPGFLGHFYVEEQGIEAGLNTVPAEFAGFRDEEYFARLRFYSERSVEIFNLWKDAFAGSTKRLIRVLGTNQGDKVLSEQMLAHIIDKYGTDNVDAIAMAPYFFGCAQNTGSCSSAPKVLKNAVTVDDVFDIIDQDVSVDPSALSGTIAKIKLQSEIATQYNVQLLSYEGGQHLTTSIMGSLELNESEKDTFRKLFKKSNRDPRMKQRYETLLNAWLGLKDQNASLFTLYTLPQSYYRFGNWGLKEHLNMTRNESPKYDGVMSFQEKIGNCWWENCE